jgi:hypothetical protein
MLMLELHAKVQSVQYNRLRRCVYSTPRLPATAPHHVWHMFFGTLMLLAMPKLRFAPLLLQEPWAGDGGMPDRALPL